MRCHQCGAEIQEGFVFCSHCGTKVQGHPSTPQPQQPKTQPSNPQWLEQALHWVKLIGGAISNAFFAFLACLARLKHDIMQKLKK